MRARSRWSLHIYALVAVTLAAIAVFWPDGRASAHANLLRASPEPGSSVALPPDRVIAWFSEPIAIQFSELRVLNEAGQRVDLGGTQPDPTEPTAMTVALQPLPDDTYTVAWRNVSTIDGHTIRGSFVFAVGVPLNAAPPTQDVPLLQSAVDPWQRWLFLTGVVVIVGGLLFELLITVPVLGLEEPDSPRGRLARSLSARLGWLLVGAFAAVAIGSLGQLLQQASGSDGVSIGGVFGKPIADVISGTSWGGLWAVRSGLFALAAASAFLAARARSRHQDDEYESVFITEAFFGPVALVLAVAGLGLTVLMSHAAAVPRDVRLPALANDFVHLSAAAVWVGGLVYLLTALPSVCKSLQGGEQREALQEIVPRFSTVALLSSGTLVITGLFSGWMQVTVPSATASPYGWALVAKVGLLVPLFAVAAVNSYLVRPRLGIDDMAAVRLRWLVTSEVVLVLLVLLAAAWLTSLEPARGYAGRTGSAADRVEFSTEAEGIRMDVAVSPLKTGYNLAQIKLKDRRGDAVTNATEVRARLSYRGEDLGAPFLSGIYHEDGLWIVHGLPVSIAGGWQVEVVVVRSDGFDARAAFAFDVAGTTTAADRIRPTRAATNALFGLEIALLGGLVILTAAPFRHGAKRAARLAATGGAVALAAGASLGGITLIFDRSTNANVNPVLPTQESVASGRASYILVCAQCHGDSGQGDGPAGVNLPKRPADLIVHVPLHPDDVLFKFIRDGIPAAQMPAQKDVLTDEQKWDLVNFLRALAQAR